MEAKMKTKLQERLLDVYYKEIEGLPEKLQAKSMLTDSRCQQSRILLNFELTAPSCESASAMLKELLCPKSCDLILKVSNETFLCHREVLIQRCEYFRAMFQHHWSESDSDEISLNSVKPVAVAAVLLFVYGASVDFPQLCSLFDILQTADMLGIQGLTSVAEYHIKSEMCHFFHRPCQGCLANFPEVVNLSSTFSMTELNASCLRWNSKYFPKLWSTKNFASSSQTFHRICLRSVVESMSLENVIHLLMETDKLLCGMTRVQWTQPVVTIATELMTSCINFITTNVTNLTSNRKIYILFEGMGWKTDVIETILIQIGEELTVDNASGVHIAITSLLYSSKKENWNEELVSLLKTLKNKIWNFLVMNYFAIIHSESWQHVDSQDKSLLKSETLCMGDENRKLAKRPVLSSSLPRNMNVKVGYKKITDKKFQSSRSGNNVEDTSELSTESHEDAVRPPPPRIGTIQEIHLAKRFSDVKLEPKQINGGS